MRRTSTYKFDSNGRPVQVHFGIIGESEPNRIDPCLDLNDVNRLVRITIHNANWDYEDNQPRHGTKATALAETPYFDEGAPGRRETLGLAIKE